MYKLISSYFFWVTLILLFPIGLAHASSLTVSPTTSADCTTISITDRVDLAGNDNNINIFNVTTGENIGSQLFDLAAVAPPHNVCTDFGFFDGVSSVPIGELPAGNYSVVEHGDPWSDACDGQNAPREFNYTTCIASADFVAKTNFNFAVSSSASIVASSISPTSLPVTTKAVSAVFTRTLAHGFVGEDVRRLQQVLNLSSDTQVAESGIGSTGNESNYFGSLTEKAVQKFQIKYGIVSAGTPRTTGFGLAGPRTREKLQEVFSNNKTSDASQQQPKQTTGFPQLSSTTVIQQQIQDALKLLKELQEQLQKLQ